MPELSAFLRPRSLQEALDLLAEHGERARPLAGGTTLVFSKSSRVDTLVDLRGVGLAEVAAADGGGVTVGAMTSMTELARYLRANGGPQVLLEAASTAGTQILQNQITLGGNCVQVYAWSDLPVALLCLGGVFTLQGKDGAREVAAEALFARAPVRTLQPGELLTGVAVPAEGEGAGSAYQKFTRTDADHSLCSVAARVALDGDGNIADAAVAVGAVRGLPQLLAPAADAVRGKAPGAAVFDEAGALAAKAAKITADYRATAGYRQQLVATMVSDMLGEAAQRAGGGS